MIRHSEISQRSSRSLRTALKWSCPLLLLLSTSTATAQFGLVIDIPPAENIGDDGSIGSSTQLNLFGGGSIGDRFNAGDPLGTSTNVEVNVSGGAVGHEYRTHSGSVTNISAGFVGDQLTAFDGSVVHVSGGRVGNDVATLAGSTLNVSGGEVGSDLVAHSDSVVNISGGFIGPYLSAGLPDASSRNVELNITGGFVSGGINVYGGSITEITGGILGWIFGSGGDSFNAHFASFVEVYGGIVDYDFDTFEEADVHFYGSEFYLDDMPLAVGNELEFNIPSGRVLSGILADGTPFALSDLLDDEIAVDTLTLHNVNVPPIDQPQIDVPSDPAPASIRGGQTLTVGPGGTLGDFFRAGPGSTLNIAGGMTGRENQTVGATVNVSAGVLNETEFVDSVVNISGGRIGSFAGAHQGTIVHMTGGETGGGFWILTGSRLDLSGGRVRDFFSATGASHVNLSGGSVGHSFFVHDGSTIDIMGGEFLLNGLPVAGLETSGQSLEINLPRDGVLSGTLADGTPFAFSSQDDDFLEDGAITLIAADVAAPGPAFIRVPSDPAPRGIREGQTLELDEGGQLGEDFTAGFGSTVLINGGSVGFNFEAVGAEVHVSGGAFASTFGALAGSDVQIAGGTLSTLLAHNDSLVSIRGGNVFGIEANEGSKVSISGGTVSGNNFTRSITAIGSEIDISGGQVAGGNLFIGNSASATISGGTIGSFFQAGVGSTVNVLGTEFLLGGQTIEGLTLNEPMLIPDRDVSLSGVLTDGAAFDFSLNSALAFGVDWFHPDAMLFVTLVESVAQLTGDYNGNGQVEQADLDLVLLHWGSDVNGLPPEWTNQRPTEGFIDQAELDAVLLNWGNQPGSLGGRGVPEPGGLSLALLMILSIAAFWRLAGRAT